jgi:hypothetical protein
VAALAGAAATCAMGLATIADRWHRPSDVVAAVLVVVGWTALVCAFAPARSAPGAGTARPAGVATRLVAILLGGIAVPAALVSVLAAAATEGYAWAALPWSGGLTAYTGGLLAACAVSAAAFAALLVVCRATTGTRGEARAAR